MPPAKQRPFEYLDDELDVYCFSGPREYPEYTSFYPRLPRQTLEPPGSDASLRSYCHNAQNSQIAIPPPADSYYPTTRSNLLPYRHRNLTTGEYAWAWDPAYPDVARHPRAIHDPYIPSPTSSNGTNEPRAAPLSPPDTIYHARRPVVASWGFYDPDSEPGPWDLAPGFGNPPATSALLARRTYEADTHATSLRMGLTAVEQLALARSGALPVPAMGLGADGRLVNAAGVSMYPRETNREGPPHPPYTMRVCRPRLGGYPGPGSFFRQNSGDLGNASSQARVLTVQPRDRGYPGYIPFGPPSSQDIQGMAAVPPRAWNHSERPRSVNGRANRTRNEENFADTSDEEWEEYDKAMWDRAGTQAIREAPAPGSTEDRSGRGNTEPGQDNSNEEVYWPNILKCLERDRRLPVVNCCVCREPLAMQLMPLQANRTDRGESAREQIVGEEEERPHLLKCEHIIGVECWERWKAARIADMMEAKCPICNAVA